MNFVPLRRRVVVAATLAAFAALSAGALTLRPSSAETKPSAPQATPVPVATVVPLDAGLLPPIATPAHSSRSGTSGP